MSTKRSSKLHVVSSGIYHFIHVPSASARNLHAYLLGKGVQLYPPQPSSSGIDSIELRKGADVKAVQALLDQWA